MAVIIQLRRGSAANWTTNNPVLAAGEIGTEVDTGKFKLGDGITDWNSLEYSSGDDGATGEVGPQGVPGEPGPAGPQGEQGPAGEGSASTVGTNTGLTGTVTLDFREDSTQIIEQGDGDIAYELTPMSPLSYAGWDPEIWHFGTDSEYPKLKWEV